MKKIGIYYGSSSGTTENVAGMIAAKLGVDFSDVHNVANAGVDDVPRYDVLLLGSSTWGAGDLQDDWYDFLAKLASLDLSGKKVAIFGCGDSSAFSDTFCDAIGTIYEDLKVTGCSFIGEVDSSGYSFDDSKACIDGVFVGLPLDEVNEDGLTAGRVDNWIVQLKNQM